MYDGYNKYDKSVAQSYDSDRENEEHWAMENQFIVDYFQQRTPTRLLDAPVGTGRFLSFYPQATDVRGLDISEQMLVMAELQKRKRLLSNCQLSQGSIFSLPFTDNYFDMSICWRLAHLLPSELLVDGLKELKRVTTGEILLQAYVRGPWHVRLLVRLKRLPGNVWRRLRYGKPGDKPWSHIRANFHAPQIFSSAFASAALDVVECKKLCDYYGHEVCVYILQKRK